MNYFIRVPNEIFEDVVSGQLKDCDLKTYIYLIKKVGSKECIYMPLEKMSEELSVNERTLKRSLSRLEGAKHIERKRTIRNTQTKLKTFVKAKNVFKVKGRLVRN
ncbi:hypothetical protein CMI37_36550 [Candidatus Pacearchaeota archaeon]|nr:hypothetical protein [Candidatus Pacearchaeota archaeon]|tara:strand:- start:1855 stop:2169 length:315 start_codon:yes stop_codon:yes gene_type:complete